MDVWSSAMLIPGAQCVMTYLAVMMPKWPAGSWDFHLMVRPLYPNNRSGVVEANLISQKESNAKHMDNFCLATPTFLDHAPL